MSFKRIHYHQKLVKTHFFVLSPTYLYHIFSYHTIINDHPSKLFSWVTMQRLSETGRSLIELSVLPGKMIISCKIIHRWLWLKQRSSVFFSQTEILTVTDLEPFFTKIVIGHHIEENWRVIGDIDE